MKALRQVIVSMMVLACLLILPSAALGQTSGVAGVVRDTSGAVLPGVTVQAASPALIEKVRVVVTDGAGLYNVVSLPIGVYTVTFTLAGFSTAIREGVQLPNNFTATVNAELRVGALEESVTVSGQSPIVDVRNTATQNLISSDKLDALPTAKTMAAFVAVTPGLYGGAGAMDVGGSLGEQSLRLVIHGSHNNDQRIYYNGMTVSGASNAFWFFVPDPAGTQEVNISLGGGAAEYDYGGTAINHIPKDGGNRFTGSFFGAYAGGGLQGDNLSADLQSRGLAANNKVGDIYDVDSGFGGPLRENKLWFFTAHRRWASSKPVAGTFGNSTPQSYLYTKDPSQPGVSDFRQRAHGLNLTWQVTPKNKFRASFDYQKHCDCHRNILSGGLGGTTAGGLVTAPEASHYRTFFPNNVPMVTWTYVATNKLLIEVGANGRIFNFPSLPQPGIPGLSLDTISVTEQSTNLNYRAAPTYTLRSISSSADQRVAVSYVTGSHSFKVGVLQHAGWLNTESNAGSALAYTFNNGAPVSLTQYAQPNRQRSNIKADLGVFGQDQWVIQRLTLNLGVRYQYANGSVPAQELPAGRFVGVRNFDPVSCSPCFHDLSPRLSVAYDVFGNGKTALKANMGRFEGAFPNPVNPVASSVTSASRAWSDANRDFIPDCDLTNFGANGECQALNNSNFGKNIVTTRNASETLNGWGHRQYNWQTSAAIQHELWPGVGVNFGYYRTAWHNLFVTQNLARTAADFDAYCIMTPIDTRLPNGGGYQVCGLYDLKTTVPFSLPANNLVQFASTFGSQTEVYNGIDLTMNARLGRGAFVQGGMSTGATATNNCYANDRPDLTPAGFVANTPRTAEFCAVKPPFWHTTQVKFAGSYPLPWAITASAVFQTYPGIPISGSVAVASAAVQTGANGLGRPLAGGTRTVTVANVITPNTRFEDRITQLDVRVTRSFKVGKTRIQANFDCYNALNASSILFANNRLGPSYLVPNQIVDARLFKVSGQISF